MRQIAEFLAERAPGQKSHPPQVVIKCATCEDKGLVRPGYPKEHPLFGHLLPCPDCGGGRPAGAAAVPDAYGLLPADYKLTWGSVKLTEASIGRCVAAVQKVLVDGYGWVYMWGDYGTAKTTILKIAIAEFIRQVTRPAIYLRMVDMLDEIRAAYDKKFPQQSAMQKVRWYSTVELLAIDELEKVNPTSFAEERRFQVLDARYEAATRQGYGVTLLAGNVPPDSSKLPKALSSRILDERFMVIHITEKDNRPYSKTFAD